MKRLSVTPAYVAVIPEQLTEGILYICDRYRVAVHKCCCGCGKDVFTPLSPADWSIKNESGAVTLQPSIGNWGMACQSHYWIRRNKVMWVARMSPAEIDRVRKRDQRDKRAYIERVNQAKDQQPNVSGDRQRHSVASQSWPYRFWMSVVRRWRS